MYQLTDEDRLALAELSVALRLSLAERSEVVRWADARIQASPEAPPDWLVELSLSNQLRILDLTGLLRRLASDVPVESICRRALNRLRRDLTTSYEDIAMLAHQIYRVVGDVMQWDFRNPLMSDATWMDDMFGLVDDGYYTRDQAMDNFDDFCRKYLSPSSSR